MLGLGLGLGIGGGGSGGGGAPAAPAGTSSLWRADLGIVPGNIATWPDQAGSVNLTASATMPICTAATGPKASQPSVVFNGASTNNLTGSAAVIGNKNFTLAYVAKGATSSAGCICASGSTANGWEFALSSAQRAAVANGVAAVFDGAAATANWEVVVWSVDNSGNVTLTVNGATHTPSPTPTTGLAPGATFAIGSVTGLAKFTGNVFEVRAYATALSGGASNAALLAYYSALTGLF